MTELVIQLGKKFQYLRLSKIILFSCMLLLIAFEQTRELFLSSASDAYIAVSTFVGAKYARYSILNYGFISR